MKGFGKDDDHFFSRFDKLSRKHSRDGDSFFSKFLNKDSICGAKNKKEFTLTKRRKSQIFSDKISVPLMMQFNVISEEDYECELQIELSMNGETCYQD